MHKEFVPEETTVNTEFYKGVLDRLLKRIQWVRPAAFFLEIFSCSTIMRPPTMLQVFANIWPKKCYNPLSPLYCQIYLRQTVFCSPSWKWSYKDSTFADIAKMQETVTDELKRSKKRNFRQLFRNCTTAQKSVYMQTELILNKKKGIYLPHGSSIFKKISPKTFGPHCV